MKKLLALALLVTLASAPLAHADRQKDCKFLEKAAESSLLWNVIGSLAQTNSTNFVLTPGEISSTNATNALILGSLGSTLTTNHALIYSNAAFLQATNGCDASTTIDKDDLKALRKLSGLQGTKFNKAFLEFVIEGTLDAIKDAQKAALNAKSAEVRAFARQLLVTLNAELVAALEAGEQVFAGDFDHIHAD